MDLFGKRRIAQLETENARLRANLLNESAQHRDEEAALRNRIEYLVRTIRDMDQEIYSMGQHLNWDQQRPYFLKLHDEMTARKVEESKRIGSLVRNEIIDTYSTNDSQRKLLK